MKIEPWVPNFMRKIADIWRADELERAAYLVDEEKNVYVYGIRTAVGVVEFRTSKPLNIRNGKLLRIEPK